MEIASLSWVMMMSGHLGLVGGTNGKYYLKQNDIYDDIKCAWSGYHFYGGDAIHLRAQGANRTCCWKEEFTEREKVDLRRKRVDNKRRWTSRKPLGGWFCFQTDQNYLRC